MKNIHALDYYGYRDFNKLIPRCGCSSVSTGMSITLSKEDGNIITIAKDGGIMASLGLEVDGVMLYLVNKMTGERLSGVEAPGAHAVSDFSFEYANNKLIVCVDKVDGTKENKFLNLSNLIKIYEAGPGVSISDDAIKVKLKQNGGLKFDDEGSIEVSDDDVAMQPELDALISSLAPSAQTISQNQSDIASLSGAVNDINSELETLSSDVEELKSRPVLSAGVGTEIAESLINVRIGSGLFVDGNGNISVSASTEPGTVVVDDHLDSASTNPVQNAAIMSEFEEIELASSAAFNDLNDRIIALSGSMEDIRIEVDTLPDTVVSELPSAGHGLGFAVVENEYYVKTGDGLTLDDNGNICVVVDDHLDITSTNPVENGVIATTLKNNEEVISASLNDLNDRINELSASSADNSYLDELSGQVATISGAVLTAEDDIDWLYNAVNGLSGDVHQLSGDMASYATLGQLQELSGKVDSLPDMSHVEDEINDKADREDLAALEQSLSGYVTTDVYNDGQAAQDALISGFASTSAVTLLNDKLSAIVDMDNIQLSGNSYIYIEPASDDTAVRPVDHSVWLLHKLEERVGSYDFDENSCDGLLTKLMRLLDGLSWEDIVAANYFLKNRSWQN